MTFRQYLGHCQVNEVMFKKKNELQECFIGYKSTRRSFEQYWKFPVQYSKRMRVFENKTLTTVSNP